MAGVIPGLLLGLMLMVAIYIVARIKKLPAQPRATFREWLTCARRAFWGLLLLVIILGGIYSGMFTPTEAAAVAAVYSALAVGSPPLLAVAPPLRSTTAGVSGTGGCAKLLRTRIWHPFAPPCLESSAFRRGSRRQRCRS